MKKKRLFLLSGAPGSGKTYWTQNRISAYGGAHISRDEVRYSLVGEDEEYFSKEDEVFKQWIALGQRALDNPYISDVYMDATHLNTKSRRKTLLHLKYDPKKVEVICVWFDIPYIICTYQNRLRSGREVVPEVVLHNMYQNRTYPSNEGFDDVWRIVS